MGNENGSERSGKKKRHHVTPEFYLRSFSPTGNPNRVWQYERGGSEPKLISVKDAGVIKHYYSVEDETELIFILAHEIAHMERRHTLRQFKATQASRLAVAVASAHASSLYE
ncbi:MAG: hypothetical protein CMK61_01885 [Pseudoalteromonadaceae bacterium]|nr:hypothetical protein [Pseudoalteromonadaceae bacterium]